MWRRARILSVISFALASVTLAFATAAQAQSPGQVPISAADSQAQADLSQIFAGLLDDTSSHMRMGPTRAATPGDSARAAAFVVTARAALSRYIDVSVAERDGYYRNMASIENQPIYHYNSLVNINAAGRGEFDATKPVSLLYKTDERGQLKLVGAMYAAGRSASPASLDSLLPISMARWHEHVSFCYPGPGITRNLPKNTNRATVFVVRLYFSITSAAECEAAHGRFEAESGWMTHVYMFAGDPKLIWDTDDAGHMGNMAQMDRMRRPPEERRP